MAKTRAVAAAARKKSLNLVKVVVCRNGVKITGEDENDCVCETVEIKGVYSFYRKPIESYGVPSAIWDYTVLPVAQHR